MASSTISKTVTIGVTLGSPAYPSPLIITRTGDIAPSAAGANALYSNVGAWYVLNQGTITAAMGSTGASGTPPFGTAGIGGRGGIGVDLVAGSLTNDGTITGGVGGTGGTGPLGGVGGAGGSGVYVVSGSLTNRGTITGGTGGAGGADLTFPALHGLSGLDGSGVVFRSGGTLIDAGVIGGGAGGADAVNFGPGASRLILDPGARFSGAVVANTLFANVLELASGASGGALIGAIGTEYQGFGGVIVDAGATWTMAAVNQLSGGGVTVLGSLSNVGVIAGATGATGTTGGTAGSAVNVSGGKLTNQGTITGGIGGAANGGNAVGGDGGGGGDGVDLAGGGLVNDGKITGGAGGAGGKGGLSGGSGGSGGNGVSLASGSLSNAGTIIGGAGGTYGFGMQIGGFGYAGTGVRFNSGGTLIDAGVINGGSQEVGTADAVYFGTGAARLILDPGASFSGAVVADAAFSNVLELASASTAGKLSGGIGPAEYQGFTSIIVDAGARWTLTAANTIAGATMSVGAGAMLDSYGSLGIDAGGSLANDGAIAGAAGSAGLPGDTGGSGGAGALACRRQRDRQRRGRRR